MFHSCRLDNRDLGELMSITVFDDRYRRSRVRANRGEQSSPRPTFPHISAGWPVVYREVGWAARFGHIERKGAGARCTILPEGLAAGRSCSEK